MIPTLTQHGPYIGNRATTGSLTLAWGKMLVNVRIVMSRTMEILDMSPQPTQTNYTESQIIN